MRGAVTAGPRVISAGDTFFAKLIIAPAFLICGGVLLWTAVRSFAANEILKSVGDLALLAMLPGTIWPLFPLKRVALSKTSLYVSNFLREIEVPLSDVSSVEEIEGTAYRVVIVFKRDTAFGRQIRFSPQGLAPPHPHPVIAELRAAVVAATSEAPLRRPW